MKFIKVDEVPGVVNMGRINHRLKADWQEFMDMNVKIAKVDLTQYNYKNVITARQVIGKSIQKWGYPIDVFKRKDEIYLVRRDM